MRASVVYQNYVKNGCGGMIADAAPQPSNPNVQAQMSNEGILPI
jgi:hypothetical protein